MLGICSFIVLVLHKTLLVPVLMYGSETMLWKKKRSTIRAVKIDSLRGMLGIRRMERVANGRIRELCIAKKGLDGKIDECVLRWFGPLKKMENDGLSREST